uniref:Uncharacterized protein n=1 Tax=Romanomermis culicivorax TaxID=13658 RepID=A0A915I0M6_ROMCU
MAMNGYRNPSDLAWGNAAVDRQVAVSNFSSGRAIGFLINGTGVSSYGRVAVAGNVNEGWRREYANLFDKW